MLKLIHHTVQNFFKNTKKNHIYYTSFDGSEPEFGCRYRIFAFLGFIFEINYVES